MLRRGGVLPARSPRSGSDGLGIGIDDRHIVEFGESRGQQKAGGGCFFSGSTLLERTRRQSSAMEEPSV